MDPLALDSQKSKILQVFTIAKSLTSMFPMIPQPLCVNELKPIYAHKGILAPNAQIWLFHPDPQIIEKFENI